MIAMMRNNPTRKTLSKVTMSMRTTMITVPHRDLAGSRHGWTSSIFLPPLRNSRRPQCLQQSRRVSWSTNVLTLSLSLESSSSLLADRVWVAALRWAPTTAETSAAATALTVPLGTLARVAARTAAETSPAPSAFTIAHIYIRQGKQLTFESHGAWDVEVCVWSPCNVKPVWPFLNSPHKSLSNLLLLDQLVRVFHARGCFLGARVPRNLQLKPSSEVLRENDNLRTFLGSTDPCSRWTCSIYTWVLPSGRNHQMSLLFQASVSVVRLCFFRALRQWRRGACRRNYKSTRARLSVLDGNTYSTGVRRNKKGFSFLKRAHLKNIEKTSFPTCLHHKVLAVQVSHHNPLHTVAVLPEKRPKAATRQQKWQQCNNNHRWKSNCSRCQTQSLLRCLEVRLCATVVLSCCRHHG